MLKPLTIAIAIFCAELFFSGNVSAEIPNYCRDKESWKTWEHFISQHYDYDDAQALHALRLGLCVKIEQGSITLDRAVTIFEKAHAQLVEKWARNEASPSEPGTPN